jgi:arginine decarboxylase
VNGSTCGVIAAILATCRPGEKIILPRNVHQSAIAGLIHAGAIPIFVHPDYDPEWDLVYSVSPLAVQAALEQHPDAKAVLVVSPTYNGVCGDITTIAQVAHSFQVPLIVDEAHGPHFAFHPDLPISALAAGADLVVQSTHKVLAALTQASMLHIQGDRISVDRVSQALQILQSSSPSYLLLASLDAARHQMATQGQDLLSQTLALANQAREQIQAIPGLSVLTFHPITPSCSEIDPTRLTVRVSDLGLDGFRADQILDQDWGVIAEFPSLQHLTFIISLGNTATDIASLVLGFRQLQDRHRCEPSSERARSRPMDAVMLSSQSATVPVLSPRDAFFAQAERVDLTQALDRISAELICPYPPGIPILWPGELITHEALQTLKTLVERGGIVTGCQDASLQTLKVVCHTAQ